MKEEEPAKEEEEKEVKTKAKKEKKPAEGGFELWNELEVQRIKFMVSRSCSSHLKHAFSFREDPENPHGFIVLMNVFVSSQNYLSRNFYNLRFLALFIAFALNFILLFYKV